MGASCAFRLRTSGRLGKLPPCADEVLFPWPDLASSFYLYLSREVCRSSPDGLPIRVRFRSSMKCDKRVSPRSKQKKNIMARAARMMNGFRFSGGSADLPGLGTAVCGVAVVVFTAAVFLTLSATLLLRACVPLFFSHGAIFFLGVFYSLLCLLGPERSFADTD